MSQNYIKKYRYYGATSKIQIETENLPSQDPVKRINALNNFNRPIRNKIHILHRQENPKDKTHVYGGECKITIGKNTYKINELKQKYGTSSYNEKKLKEKSYISQNTSNIAHKDKISEKTKKTIENKKGNSYQISNLDSKIEQNENTNKRNPNKHNHTYYESNYRISPQLSHISKESSNKKKFTDLGDNFLQSLDNSFKLFLNDLSKSQTDNNEKLVKSLSESLAASNEKLLKSLSESFTANNEILVKSLSESFTASNEILVKNLSESQTARNKEFIASLISELKEENKSFINELFKKK